jgi:hypothetical protein
LAPKFSKADIVKMFPPPLSTTKDVPIPFDYAFSDPESEKELIRMQKLCKAKETNLSVNLLSSFSNEGSDDCNDEDWNSGDEKTNLDDDSEWGDEEEAFDLDGEATIKEGWNSETIDYVSPDIDPGSKEIMLCAFVPEMLKDSLSIAGQGS